MSHFDAFADFRMTGHKALVTGGAQNIGAAIARTFSGAGAEVMIADTQRREGPGHSRRDPGRNRQSCARHRL
ncbi:MAG: hypothetical protein ACKO22_06870 [Cyanobium sp.]